MCLAIPSKVYSVEDINAIVDIGGARKNVSLMLMPEPVCEGDYVLVHAGYAIQKVDEEAALEAIRLLNEMVDLLEAEGALCEPLDPHDDEGYIKAPTMPDLR